MVFFFHDPLGKRQSGADDAPSELEIISWLSHDMRVAYEAMIYATRRRTASLDKRPFINAVNSFNGVLDKWSYVLT